MLLPPPWNCREKEEAPPARQAKAAVHRDQRGQPGRVRRARARPSTRSSRRRPPERRGRRPRRSRCASRLRSSNSQKSRRALHPTERAATARARTRRRARGCVIPGRRGDGGASCSARSGRRSAGTTRWRRRRWPGPRLRRRAGVAQAADPVARSSVDLAQAGGEGARRTSLRSYRRPLSPRRWRGSASNLPVLATMRRRACPGRR